MYEAAQQYGGCESQTTDSTPHSPLYSDRTHSDSKKHSKSSMAQWKGAGLITQRTLDRNQVLLKVWISFFS
jgi:hypothetical protein